MQIVIKHEVCKLGHDMSKGDWSRVHLIQSSSSVALVCISVF